MVAKKELLQFEGVGNFRQVLILSLLSGHPIVIEEIRTLEDDPGLQDAEISLLKLIDELTNGTRTKLNETGTRLLFHPGFIIGGEVEHDCDVSRSIGYYMEVAVCLAAFSKQKFNLTLNGVTHGYSDPSADTIKHVTMPLCKKLGLHSAELKIPKRGFAPLGGGQVSFTCNTLTAVKPFQWLDEGKIKRVRGVATCMRMSPATNPRVIDTARGVLNDFLPDVYIYNEHPKGEASGKSPGFNLTLYTESTTDAVLSVDMPSEAQMLPEDMGKETVYSLLNQISQGGCVDSTHQYLVLLYMCLTQNNVSRVRLGPLTPYTIRFLRNLKKFFGVVFKVDVEKKDVDDVGNKRGLNATLLLSCVGIGFTNMNRTMT